MVQEMVEHFQITSTKIAFVSSLRSSENNLRINLLIARTRVFVHGVGF